jgi:ribosomal protein L11 methyltransferase
MIADELTVISCAIAEEDVDALCELLDADDYTPTSWLDVETKRCRIDVFLEDASQAKRVCNALSQAAELAGLPELKLELSTLARTDWAEAWKRFFHVERVSERIVVRPSWEHYEAKPGEAVITLDPGLSFGTGKHATTQGCLRFLDQLAAEDVNRSVLDMGCGSGILAIAAALLGFKEVRGFDNDPDCKRVSEENAAINRVAIPFTIDDLSHPHPAADIVVANILAPVLIAFAKPIVDSLSRYCHTLQGVTVSPSLIVSGILEEQYDAVKAAYETLGMREADSIRIENWRTGLFKRV